MLSDEIRRRLAEIHRLPAASAPMPPLVSSAAPLRVAHLAADDKLWEHAHECETPAGRHLRLLRPLGTLCPSWEPRRPVAPPAGTATAQIHPELAAVAASFPAGTMFLDLETCGFAGAPIFLAGLVWLRDGQLMLDQLLARNYTEERALLLSLWEVASGNQVLVTFNGKSFDWPMVHDRSTRHHLGRDRRGSTRPAAAGWQPGQALERHVPRPELTHCDLLHHARRRWKHVLPNCRLQTLERYICNRARHNDLPGSEVPAAYHEYVRSGTTQKLEAILHHNALDLATLVQVTLRLAGGQAMPDRRSAAG